MIALPSIKFFPLSSSISRRILSISFAREGSFGWEEKRVRSSIKALSLLPVRARKLDGFHCKENRTLTQIRKRKGLPKQSLRMRRGEGESALWVGEGEIVFLLFEETCCSIAQQSNFFFLKRRKSGRGWRGRRSRRWKNWESLRVRLDGTREVVFTEVLVSFVSQSLQLLCQLLLLLLHFAAEHREQNLDSSFLLTDT